MRGGARRAARLLVLGFALVQGCQPVWERTASAPACTVEAVTDGDSIRCADERRIRLLAIDSPEMQQAPHGREARDFLRSLVSPGDRLRLELDRETEDRYGRTLAYAYLPDGRMANLEMARAGYAVDLIYPPNRRHEDRIRAAVAQAREDRRGLWATAAFRCLPRDFRARRCGR